VAGVGGQNKFVPQGTVECVFSVVPSGRNDLRTAFQPLRSWLISGAPSAQKNARQELFGAGHKLAAGIVFQRETKQAANQAAQ
jgi:hypothetical protein